MFIWICVVCYVQDNWSLVNSSSFVFFNPPKWKLFSLSWSYTGLPESSHENISLKLVFKCFAAEKCQFVCVPEHLNQIWDNSPLRQHVFHFSPPYFISLHSVGFTSLYLPSVHLSWIINDGCQAEKHSKPNSIHFLVNFTEDAAELSKKTLFLFSCALPPVLHHLQGVSVTGDATVASNKCSFSVSTAAAVTSCPCQAELQFGEDRVSV